MDSIVKHFKVDEFPTNPEPNAYYWKENAGTAEMRVTTATGQYRKIRNTAEGRTVSGTTATITAADHGNYLVLTNNSAITLVIPAGLGVNFAFGIVHRGSGLVSFSLGSGVTVNNADGHTKLRKGMSSFISVAANDFEFGGATDV